MLVWLMRLQKNLSIEKSIANDLGSDQIHHHLLNKSHTIEALLSTVYDNEVSKRISLYQQRRFAKLGKAWASLLKALLVLTKLLDETEGTNQLVEACRIHLASKIFLAELEVFAFFNHVTFPTLH